MSAIPRIGYNPHGVYNNCGWGAMEYNWLGAKVHIKVFGKWREAEICEVDESALGGILLVCALWDGNKRVEVSAPYQAYRKERSDD